MFDFNECFSYQPETGFLFWKARPEHHFSTPGRARGWNKRFAGAKLSTVDGKGYLHVLLSGRFIRVHRIVWALHHGAMPDVIVDHINGDKQDNRIENLRLATAAQNNMNKKKNTGADASLPKGVYRHRRSFVAQIKWDGEVVYLGSFPTPEGAHAKYLSAASYLFGDFHRAR